MAYSCLNSIDRVRNSRYSGESTSYLVDEILDAGSVQLPLLQCSFHRLGICPYLRRAVNLVRMSSQQLNKLPDLV